MHSRPTLFSRIDADVLAFANYAQMNGTHSVAIFIESELIADALEFLNVQQSWFESLGLAACLLQGVSQYLGGFIAQHRAKGWERPNLSS